MRPRGSIRLLVATALACAATTGVGLAAEPRRAVALSTDVALQTFNVSPASTAGTPRSPGQVFTYTIGFSCDSSVSDTCAGAVIESVLPTFTDVFGGTSQLVATGTPAGTPGIWSSGPAFSGTAPDVRLTGTLNASAQAGQLYSLSFTATAPTGLFPVGVTSLPASASASGGQTSPTVTSHVEASAPSWTADKTGPAQLLLGANGTYDVRACPASTASALPASFTFEDLLPAGATFVSASHGGTPPANSVADGTSDAITWTFDGSNRPWPMSGSCVAVTAVVRFDESVAVGNLTGALKTNTMSGTFDATSLGTDTVQTELRGPITSVNGTKSVGVGGYYVKAGDTVRYHLRFANSSETGAAALDGAVMVDDLTAAADFDLDTVTVGTWGSGVTAVVEISPDGTTWTDLGGSPYTGAASLAVPVPDGQRWVRWTFTGPIPVGFATSGARLEGTMTTPGAPPVTQTNCLDAVGTRGVNTYTDAGNCVDVLLEDPQAHPAVAKTITSVTAPDGSAHTAATVAPGDVIAYQISVSNHSDATGALTDPVVTDCVARTAFLRDPVVTAGNGWSVDAGHTDAACTGDGGTPVRLVYGGSAIAAGASSVAATYAVQTTQFGDPEGVTVAGTYPNTASLSKASGSFAHGTFTSTATATVPAYIFLSSQKWVLGARDVDAGPGPDQARVAGETDPGGSMRWYLTVRNQGNVPAKDPVYVDVFPFVGDTGVKRTDQQRSSEWAPYLVTPIAAPPGWTVQYSTSSNPCRQEVGPTPASSTTWPAGCQAPGWTTDSSMFALTTYRSIRLAYTGTIAVGAPEIEFSWDMRAPVTHASYDVPSAVPSYPYERLTACNVDPNLTTQDPTTLSPCPRAINSFAWAAEADPAAIAPSLNPGRLSTEPPRAGIQITALPTSGNILGDRVWADVDFDGIQDAGEIGVSGVHVELLKYDAVLSQYDSFGATYTDANGDYLFAGSAEPSATGLPDGTYRLRFSLPPQWYVSPRDRDGLGSGDNQGGTDSDVDQAASGTASGVAHHDTVDIALSGNETDLTWDLGIWTAAPAIDIVKTTRDSAWPANQAGDGVTVLRGRPVTWTYTITNTGNTRLEGVVVRDDAGTPAGTDDVTVTSCVVTQPGTTDDPSRPSSATAPMALNRGGVLTCTLTGTAGSAAYSNVGTVTGAPRLDDGSTITRGSPPASVTDTDPSNYVVATYDLALAKTAGAIDYASGHVTYTIVVRNQGTVASGAFEVTDTLPAGMTSTSASPTGPTVTTVGANERVTWSGLPSLAPGASATITLVAHIDDYLAGPFRNFAEISADSAALVQSGGVTTATADVDSTPDADTGDDMPGGKTYGPIGAPTAGGADTIEVGSAGTGTDGEDDADIADVVATPTYDLALAKVANATALQVDGSGTIAYTITVENQGNVASGVHRVTDTLPAGLSVVTPVPGGGVVQSGATTRIEWVAASLDPGETATFTFSATVTDVTQRPFRNIAEISSDPARAVYGVDDVDSTPDAITTNDMSGTSYGPVGAPTAGGADNITVADAGTGTDGEDDADIADVDLPLTGRYDLALAKTVDQPSIALDSTITYVITVQNQGVLDSGEVVVTDHVPAGLRVVHAGGGSVDEVARTIDWTIANLEPGSTSSLTFTAQVSDVTQRPFRNVAEISGDSADSYSSAGEAVVDADSTPDTNPADDGDYGTVMAGAPIDNVAGGAGPGSPAIASAGVGADAPASGGEDDADVADVDLPVTYDLALVKTATEVAGDGTVQFTIVVANQGDVPSLPYDVTDVLPSGMVGTGASDGGTLTSATTVVWSGLPSLPPGGTETLTISARVVDFGLRPFTNRAEITADGAASYSTSTVVITDADSVPGDVATSASDASMLAEAGTGSDAGFDDEDIAVVTIVPVYDLALVKTGDVATTTYDGTVTFTITVKNQGNVPSGSFAVSDALPAGVALVAASAGGTPSADARSVTWALPSIDAGASTSVTLTVAVTDVRQRPFVNRAEISADGSHHYSLPAGPAITDRDSVPADVASSVVDSLSIEEAGAGEDAGFDDEDTARFDVPIRYDLDLVKTLPAGQSLKLGSSIVYEIKVTNTGNVPSGLHTVRDDLPVGLTFVEASHGGSASGRVVTWDALASLSPGASRTVTVRVRIDDVTQPSYVNVAAIVADGSAELSTPVDPVSDVDSHPSAPAPPGSPTSGEDDEGVASLPMPQLAADNPSEPVPAAPTTTRPSGGWALPLTGGDVAGSLVAAGALVLIGLVLRRGRPRRLAAEPES